MTARCWRCTSATAATRSSPPSCSRHPRDGVRLRSAGSAKSAVVRHEGQGAEAIDRRAGTLESIACGPRTSSPRAGGRARVTRLAGTRPAQNQAVTAAGAGEASAPSRPRVRSTWAGSPNGTGMNSVVPASTRRRSSRSTASSSPGHEVGRRRHALELEHRPVARQVVGGAEALGSPGPGAVGVGGDADRQAHAPPRRRTARRPTRRRRCGGRCGGQGAYARPGGDRAVGELAGDAQHGGPSAASRTVGAGACGTAIWPATWSSSPRTSTASPRSSGTRADRYCRVWAAGRSNGRPNAPSMIGRVAGPDSEGEATADRRLHGERLGGEGEGMARRGRHDRGAEADAGDGAPRHGDGAEGVPAEVLRPPGIGEPEVGDVADLVDHVVERLRAGQLEADGGADVHGVSPVRCGGSLRSLADYTEAASVLQRPMTTADTSTPATESEPEPARRVRAACRAAQSRAPARRGRRRLRRAGDRGLARGRRPAGGGRHRHALPPLPDPRRPGGGADRGRGRAISWRWRTACWPPPIPFGALRTWLTALIGHVTRYRGLASSLVDARCGEGRLSESCHRQEAAATALVERARDAGGSAAT